MQDSSALYQSLFPGSANNQRMNQSNLPMSTNNNNNNNNNSNNMKNNQPNNQSNNQQMNPNPNATNQQTFYSYMPMPTQPNNEQLNQSHQQQGNQPYQYPIVPTFPTSYQNNQSLNQQLNQQVLSSPLPMTGGMINGLQDFRMPNSYQPAQSMNPSLNPSFLMGTNPAQPLMNMPTFQPMQKPNLAHMLPGPMPQQPSEPSSPRRNEKRGRAATTETTATLRRRKHKEVEIRRRKKINSLFTELSHELDCGPTDKASVLLYGLNFIKSMKRKHGDSLDMKTLTGSNNMSIVADDIRAEAEELGGYESSETDEKEGHVKTESRPLTISTSSTAPPSVVTSPQYPRPTFTADASTVLSIPPSPATQQPGAHESDEKKTSGDDTIHPAASVLFAASKAGKSSTD